MRFVNQAFETISYSVQLILSLVWQPIEFNPRYYLLAQCFLWKVVIFLLVWEGKVPPSITS
jgi:hypothetical protein